MTKELRSHKDYQSLFASVKAKIQNSQMKAALAVNSELLLLYWDLGEMILDQQKSAAWGSDFLTQLSTDIKKEFPDTKGFSATNLDYMRRWVVFYSTESANSPQLVAELGIEASSVISPQLVGENKSTDQTEIIKQIITRIPWGHNREIISKSKTVKEALFYVISTIQNNWSRAVLNLQISSDLYARKGSAITNFKNTLPTHQSDLARETLKNPYNFDFLTLEVDAQERDLERALIQNIKKFLLELGKGFAYVGNQYNLKVEDDDFFLDLLFFNYTLNRFVIFELKVGDFKAEYTGKLNMYINTVDKKIKQAHHEPTIGVLLCKTPNKTVVEYSIENIQAPMGITEFKLPKELKQGMPTVKQLEKELEKEIEIEQKPIDKKLSQLKNIITKSKKKRLEKEKDLSVIKDIANRVVIPMYEMFLEKHATMGFHDMFMEITYDFMVANHINKSVEDFVKDIDAKENIDSLRFEVRYKGFKQNGTDTFDHFEMIDFKLEDFIYTINDWTDKLFKIQKMYDEIVSENEIAEIVDTILEKTLDTISYNLKRTNPQNGKDGEI